MVRARVKIRGTRALVQNQFGPESIPLEKQEKDGAAGNVPNEWKKTCMRTADGQLYVPGTYVFGCLRNGSFHTKKGRGSIQSDLVSTLEVEDEIVLISNRTSPPDNKLTQQRTTAPDDPKIDVFIYVACVKNPKTKGRNVRYRLTARAGWECRFTIKWDKTIVARNQMEAVLRDSGRLGGLGDALKIGCGRFEVVSYKELHDAEEPSAERSVGNHETNGVEPRRKKVRAV
jgi:hypothetical protein